MDCVSCDKRCCSNMDGVLLDIFEFGYLMKKYHHIIDFKKFPFKIEKFIIKLQMPCVFLNKKNGKCDIYDDRPLMCRKFPFINTDEEQFPNDFALSFSPFCTQYNNLIKMSTDESKSLLNNDFNEAFQVNARIEAHQIILYEIATPQDKNIIKNQLKNNSKIERNEKHLTLVNGFPKRYYNKGVESEVKSLMPDIENYRKLYLMFKNFKHDNKIN